MEQFISFVILLVISVIVSGVLQYGLKFTYRPGPWPFVFKVVVGYQGASWGTAAYGQWWEGLNYQDVYYIPAILGAFSLVVFVIGLVIVFGRNPN